jgi:hypothetical protein
MLEEVDHRAMRHAHALGRAGRTGGVDHVGDRVAAGRRRGGGFGGRQRRVAVEQQRVRPRDRVGQRRLRDQQRELRIGGHEREPLARKGRIERHVAGAGTQHAEQRGEHVGAAFERDADQRAGADAARAHGGGDPFGARGELRIAPARVAAAQRRPFGRLRGLGEEARLDPRTGLERRRRRLQRAQLGQAGRRQQRQRGERLLRIVRRRAQQRRVRIEPARDRRRVEQVGVVLAFQPQRAVDLHGVDEQLEVLEAARHAGQLEVQVGEAQRVLVDRLVEIEQHADQRQACRIARERQALEQRAERVTLVLERIEQVAAQALERVGERSGGVERDAQRQHVDGMADQGVVAVGGLAGGRDADDLIVLAGQALQQRGEAGQQRRVEAGAAPRTGAAQVADQRSVERVVDPARCGRASPRAWAVQRQFQRRRQLRVARQPVALVVAAGFAVRVARLGQRELGERVGGGQARRFAAALGRVQRSELAHEHAERPAVADEVVRVQQQQVLVLAQAQQFGRDQRAAFEVERRFDDALQRRFDRGRARIRVERREVALLPGQFDPLGDA